MLRLEFREVKYLIKWLLYLCVVISRYSQGYDIMDFTLTKSLRTRMSDYVGKTAIDPQLLKEATVNDKIQKEVPQSTEFPCRFIRPVESRARPRGKGTRNIRNKNRKPGLPLRRSLVRPNSVHALRPGDIDVVAAMGDSFTTGSGAAGTTVYQLSTENRGISWSIGGQGTWRQFITLPNILKVFNPNLIGYSLTDSFEFENASQFNVAKPMALSKHMPDMAKELVNRIRNDKRVNFEKDWKLVTILIGGNDLCTLICFRTKPLSAPEIHRKDMIEALLILKNNLPRTFVNIVPSQDIHMMMSINPVMLSPMCNLLRMIECRCKYTERNMSEFYRNIFDRWVQVDLQLENAPELNGKEDFAVVSQSFIVNSKLLKRNDLTDMSMLAADCFHFSQKGQAITANALWNNMLQPKGKKQEGFRELFKNFECPTIKSPYLFTSNNSKAKNG